MDTLPLELKQRVCSYLTPNDLKSLRLTSKIYASAACRDFLPRIFLHNHPSSFEEIQDITNHPDLKHSVTTLVVDTSCLSSYPRYDDWARRFVPTPTYRAELERLEIPADSQDARTVRRLRREKVCEKWKAYQDRASAQRKKSSKDCIFNNIALAFQKCPRLKHLIVESGGSYQCSSALSKRMLRLYKDDLPSSTTHSTTHAGFWDMMTFDIWDLLNPIHDADQALESLVLLDQRLVCYQNRTLPDASIFKSLKHLRESGSPVNFLTSVVASAPGLETFGTIDMTHYRSSASLSALTNGPPLPKLRACSLSNLIDEDCLINFLLRQSDTLQRLRIHHGQWFLGPNWATVAARVKGKLRNLRRVELEIGPPTIDARTRLGNYDVLTERDILQDHEHELEAGPMEIYDGLWEDYEKMFFPEVTKL
ncbi:hypothetical protein KCU65_g4966, partial [Aureobasidium melanogenum]